MLNIVPSSCFDSTHSSSSSSGEKATFANFEHYVELLYEDLNDKVKGAALIMQLSRDNDNLEELARNGIILLLLKCIFYFEIHFSKL